jgi:hypothetical protein
VADPFRSLVKREESNAEELAQAAAVHGRSAISATLSRAASLAVASIANDQRRGAILEPAFDLRALRTDPGLQIAKREDGHRAEVMAHEAIVDSIRAGYEYDARERAAIVEERATGLTLTVDLSEEELSALESFPVAGFTAAELAGRLRTQFEQAIDQTLALPISGLLDAKAVPAALGEVARLHGVRCASAVREAYFAGVRAAQGALLRALGGR